MICNSVHYFLKYFYLYAKNIIYEKSYWYFQAKMKSDVLGY